jgi:hypothetical protein
MNNCVSISQAPLIVKQECGRKVILSNPSRKKVEIGVVDGCLISNAPIERCDYYFQLSNEYIYYVELKGSDIKKAISQIISTIVTIVEKKSINNKIGMVVCSKVPRASTAYQKAILSKKKEMSKLGLKIIKLSCIVGKIIL